MNGGKKNLPASVAARLLNHAKQAGDNYQTLLTSFCFERFLFRLGASEVRERFVLKGAMLLRLWSDRPYRATRDLDLPRRGDGSGEAIRSDIRTICTTPVGPDAVEFDADAIRIEAIRAADEHAGTRALLPTRCGTARLNLQIDIGLGDSVWPPPQSCTYPSLLDFPAPEVLACPREVVIAEKLEAIVVLGDRNGRIKDFFDLHYLASHFTFDRATLAEAVRRSFAIRQTPIPAEPPIGLTSEYWENPSRPSQVRAFARRAGLAVPDDPGEESIGFLGAFRSPLVEPVIGVDPDLDATLGRLAALDQEVHREWVALEEDRRTLPIRLVHLKDWWARPLPPMDERPWSPDAPLLTKLAGTLRNYGPMALVRELGSWLRWQRMAEEGREEAIRGGR